MYRIIGLWNYEEKYQDTPHNIGGQLLLSLYQKKEFDFLKKTTSIFFGKSRKSQIIEGEWECLGKEKDFEILLPETFMNNSGDVLLGQFSKKEKERKKEIEKLIVVYDDIDLPFGKVKISFGRGDGGHNGIKDIIKKIRSKNFIRIRIGVCPLDFFGNCKKPRGDSVSKYLVNKKMSKKQLKLMSEIEEKVGQSIEGILCQGYQKTMNKIN